MSIAVINPRFLQKTTKKIIHIFAKDEKTPVKIAMGIGLPSIKMTA
ncbi:MAG: hypothetical protein J5597_02840 [Spirochaetaceae bacterium]|nr:hypothetical protein [Spirochaetaceae bacterium]